MKFSKTKLMIFHRECDDLELILLTPHGELSKLFYCSGWYRPLLERSPCYGPPYVKKTEDGYVKKFPSPKAAYKAMRAYEKREGIPPAEFIGTI